MTKISALTRASALCCAIVAWTPAVAQLQSAANRQQMIELGRSYANARALYEGLRERAGASTVLTWDRIPDWSGVYTRDGSPFFFDPAQAQAADGLPTAKLTPEYRAIMLKRIADRDKGIEYDPISACAPPGHPRWLSEPFLREFAVTPQQTWLINEMMNDVRRIYTDGRDHPPPADAYPLFEGDSIGFWDGDKLVIHTNQLRGGIYQRGQPDYTDQAETVEIWRKVSDREIEVDVWVYDPPVLVEPWYSKQRYARLTNDDKSLRLRFWHCTENQNNAIIETDEGGSDFQDFDFTPADDRKENPDE